MTKDDVIKMMMDSINADNREFCLMSGMSEEEADKNIEQSQMSLGVIIGNIYDKLVEANVIVV
jgi:hypothetical protein